VTPKVRLGLDWIGLDWIGLDWIGLDWIGLDWIGLDWIGAILTLDSIHWTPEGWDELVYRLNDKLLMQWLKAKVVIGRGDCHGDDRADCNGNCHGDCTLSRLKGCVCTWQHTRHWHLSQPPIAKTLKVVSVLIFI
jgi:hypothetical protein